MLRLSSDDCDVEDLYKFADQTGLLSTHGRWREATFLESEVRPAGVSPALIITGNYLLSQADIKILYYELIRMITNYDRQHCRDPQTFDHAKSISKIDGYQVIRSQTKSHQMISLNGPKRMLKHERLIFYILRI